MNSLRGTLQGVVTALGTPLDRNEDLHEAGMRKQIRMQLAAGVDGLLVLGSMGCMQMLKDEVFVEAVEVTIDEVRGAVPVIVGCGDTSTERTLARIRLAENYPLTGVALIPPFIFRFSQTELHDYFTGVASQTSLPVYPYDNPGLTGHSLEFELVRELANHPNIVGLKASGDFLTFRRSAEYFRGSEFAVLSGHTTFFDLALHLGAQGIIEGLFALAPEFGVEIYRSFQEGDPEGSAAAQRKLLGLREVVAFDSVFAGFTSAMNLRGVPGNFTPRPFAQPTERGRDQVEAVLRGLDLLE